MDTGRRRKRICPTNFSSPASQYKHRRDSDARWRASLAKILHILDTVATTDQPPNRKSRHVLLQNAIQRIKDIESEIGSSENAIRTYRNSFAEFEETYQRKVKDCQASQK